MIRHACSTALGGLVLVLMAQGTALAQTPAPAKNECFFTRQFENWKSSKDEKTMYIRVGMNRFYRLDLAYQCHDLSMPDTSLISQFRTDSICSPLDFDFKLHRSGVGITTPCQVKTMIPMTPAEVAALPKDEKP